MKTINQFVRRNIAKLKREATTTRQHSVVESQMGGCDSGAVVDGPHVEGTIDGPDTGHA
jgi:hypothetical protein